MVTAIRLSCDGVKRWARGRVTGALPAVNTTGRSARADLVTETVAGHSAGPANRSAVEGMVAAVGLEPTTRGL
jgi:hypothetical protein